MVGVLSFFTNFLILLGEAITPIAGIMAVDYYVLRRSRKVLDISRAKGALPDKVETWNPVAIIAWALGFIAGIFSTDFGIPAINSLVVGALTYLVIMKLSVTFFGKKRLEL
jgi:cytosine permease